MVVVVVALVLAPACATVSRLNLLSTQQEVAIGRQAAEDVEQQMAMLDDPAVTAYVADLGRALSRHAKRQDVVYRFRVVDTEVVNAFALPGGWLYVNAGLIAAADHRSELAGVIAHEIGHVVGRHGARQITAQFGLSVLLEMVAGGPGSESLARDIAAQFAGVGAGMTLLKYSRDMEREADVSAVDMTHSAGMDPLGVATFFEKLQQMHEQEPAGVEVLFSTHPPTAERVESVKSEAAKLPSVSGESEEDRERYRRIRERVRRHLASKPKR